MQVTLAFMDLICLTVDGAKITLIKIDKINSYTVADNPTFELIGTRKLPSC